MAPDSFGALLMLGEMWQRAPGGIGVIGQLGLLLTVGRCHFDKDTDQCYMVMVNFGRGKFQPKFSAVFPFGRFTQVLIDEGPVEQTG